MKKNKEKIERSWFVLLKKLKKPDFKIKLGIIFCLVPVAVLVIYGIIFYLCNCKLSFLSNLPFYIISRPFFIYESFVKALFPCGKNDYGINCIVGPLLWLALYFLTLFISGWLIGFIIHKKIKK